MRKEERQNKIIAAVTAKGAHQVLSTRKLAENFGVSEITIRRDLQELAKSGLIQRQHGGVTLQTTPATPLRYVGILLTSTRGKFSHPFFNELLEGADSELQKLGYHPAFVKTFSEVDSDEAIQELINLRPIDGLMIIGELNEQRLNRWRQHTRNIVSLPMNEVLHSDRIICDGYNGAQQMLQYLTAQGHKRIGFVVAKNRTEHPDIRLTSFLDGIKTYHLDNDPDLICELHQPLEIYPLDVGRQGAEHLMNLKNPPTVIMCSSDMIALGALQWLQSNNYTVPKDVSVTGFDNINESQLSYPPLTTIHVHKQYMGRLAAEQLHRRIQNPDDPHITITTPTSLVIRDSVTKTKA